MRPLVLCGCSSVICVGSNMQIHTCSGYVCSVCLLQTSPASLLVCLGTWSSSGGLATLGLLHPDNVFSSNA